MTNEQVHPHDQGTAALRGDGGDVGPAQGPDDVHHGLGLERVRGNHPREEVVAPVVAQLRGRRRVADLWDLKKEEGNRSRFPSRPAAPLPRAAPARVCFEVLVLLRRAEKPKRDSHARYLTRRAGATAWEESVDGSQREPG
ncbi:hypothetical protein EYF80_047211 [Liparis tanakae]|uniref:Uncharacterized protein n=1 Tax=Liparis tanakae TaxID=230148 RepID=A0A4Z2FN77_9TELE|nr:hypothetical protein EYF80_047211 [Liparis tanakae]